MKRTFPNKGKSVANSKFQTKATTENFKQTNVGSSKGYSSAAMIGLAAISTTMGTSSILFSGEGDRAVAAERIPEINVTGVNRPKGSLLEKLTQPYVDTQVINNSGVGVNKSETVLPSEQKLSGQSFFPVELRKEKLNQQKTNNLPPLGSIGKVQANQTISSNGQVELEQLKTKINTAEKQKNRPTKSSVEWRSEESVSESGEKPFNSSKRKSLEDIYQKPKNLVVAEPQLEIPNSQVDNSSSTAREVSNAQTDISQKSLNTDATKVEGAVVIDSKMTSTPVSLVYKVRVGDTLSLIAQQHNVSVEQLTEINQIKNPNVIAASKLLKIPQQPFSQSLTLASSSRDYDPNLQLNTSGKQEVSQPLKATKNEVDFPEAKLPNIESDYLSYSTSVTNSKVSTNSRLQLVSWPQDADYQKNQQSKELISSKDSFAKNSNKTPLVNGKVWPNDLESGESQGNYSVDVENKINHSNNPTVPQLPVNRYSQDSESLRINQNQTNDQNKEENPYANRLRSEISRLRQEYNAQKDLEKSQTNNSESIVIPVPEPGSSENNLSSLPVNPQIPTDNRNNNSPYLQPTYQAEISSPQTRQWSENITNRPEIRNPATVVKELPLEGQVNSSNQLSIMATAPIRGNADEILNNPSIGKMVSPDLPPLGQADTYLPGGSMQFTGYTWPAKGIFTSGYGWRWGRMHRGIDIAAPTGTPIVAAAPGVVTYADWNSGGYGNLVEIKHPNGGLTIYAHNSQILVRKGQKVAQGELIAKMGSTGRSTGPHLHFEIHPKGNGAVDPMAYLPSGMGYN
ncbi:MAG: peptidoglycan DD-metalloendopeptidase family protein [Trichodesmium sp.]